MSQAEIIISNISFSYPETDRNVFSDISISLDGGFTSLVGQNGTGKTTLLLLAGGRLLPEKGEITIQGEKTEKSGDEEQRNRIVSFVYQNMEFETDQSVGDLFEYIYENGISRKKSGTFISEITDEFGLTSSISKKMQEMSKGDIQKSVIIFSLLYGSPIVMMDEPVFALENRDKELIMDYLKSFSTEHGTSIYLSVHELDLSRKYTNNIIAFYKNGLLEKGTTSALLSPKKLEQIYEVPAAMLYEKEDLYRNHLNEEHALMKEQMEELKNKKN